MSKNELFEFDEQSMDNISDCLKKQGYIVMTKSLNHTLLQDLQKRGQSLTSEDWMQSGIGRAQGYQINKDIRLDKISWINTSNVVETSFLKCMESLRKGINRRLFLGAFEYECHFSNYPKGCYYKKHIDALEGNKNRVLSTVLYLNSNWKTEDAGELHLYSEQGDKLVHCVLPQLGTLVVFFSEKIPHEVIRTNRRRYSIAGWFKVNQSN